MASQGGKTDKNVQWHKREGKVLGGGGKDHGGGLEKGFVVKGSSTFWGTEVEGEGQICGVYNKKVIL